MGRMIPGVDCSLLHPVFAARLDHALNDPRIQGKVRVVSSTRTRAQQAALYAAYLAGTGNTAANPDAVTTGAYGLPQRYGSWHMQQPDGYGYAVDLNWSELDPRTAALTEAILQDHRLIRTVFSPQYEPWHWQMSWSDWTWTPTTQEDDMFDDDDRARLDECYRQLTALTYKRGQKAPRPLRSPVGEILKWVAAIGAKLGVKKPFS